MAILRLHLEAAKHCFRIRRPPDRKRTDNADDVTDWEDAAEGRRFRRQRRRHRRRRAERTIERLRHKPENRLQRRSRHSGDDDADADDDQAATDHGLSEDLHLGGQCTGKRGSNRSFVLSVPKTR